MTETAAALQLWAIKVSVHVVATGLFTLPFAAVATLIAGVPFAQTWGVLWAILFISGR